MKEELVFLSPCIAKKSEITDKNTHGYVKYNVTFKRLMDVIGDKYKTAKGGRRGIRLWTGCKISEAGGD